MRIPEFRQHPLYPEVFVSDNGIVIGPTGILKPRVNNRGYRVVRVGRSGSRFTTKGVHRLMCEAFYGLQPKMQAAHGDGDPSNNRLSNLRWATPKENAADRITHGTHGRKLTEEQVLSMRARHASGESFRSLAPVFGVTASTVYAIVTHRTWKHLTDNRSTK